METKPITTKKLREEMGEIVDRVRDQGASYTVFYRSLPAFKIVPIKQSRSQLSDEEVDKILDDIGEDNIDWSKKGDPKFDALIKKHGKNLPGYKRHY